MSRNMLKVTVGTIISFVLVFAASALGQQPGTEQYVPGQIIIKVKDSTTPQERQELAASLNATVRQQFTSIGAELWDIGTMPVEDAIGVLSPDPRVEYVEPNHIWYAIDTFPDDPSFNLLWGLHNTGQTGGTPDADIDAPEAWDITRGDSVVIGVIDTGVDWMHPDLAENIFTNPGEIPNNQIDDDNNGFVDDVHGWDFVNNDNNPFDDNSHGTHVSGTIAALGNNGVGVVGVSWRARILPIKFLSAGGSGSTANAILSVQYATMMGVKLTNNSWGGGGFSQSLKDAIQAAGDAGQLFIAAAGNSGLNTDSNPHYPSSYDNDNIIAVASTDHNDLRSGFSNYGATSVDLGAPGSGIFSTVPNNGYGYKSGTSMATPHVSGACGLLWAVAPNMGHLEVKDRIMTFVDPIPSMNGITVSGGRLNVFNIVSGLDSIPPAPVSDLTIISTGSNTATLQFTASGDDGTDGTAMAYDIRYSTDGIYWSNFDDAPRFDYSGPVQPSGSTETIQVTGLDFETPYFFALKVLDEQANTSWISNLPPAATTLGIPAIEVSPTSLNDDLYTGGVSSHTITIRNTAVGTLDFTIMGPLPGWVSANPSAGRVYAGESMDVEIGFDATGLPGGDYDEVIEIASNDPDQPVVPVDVHLHVTDAADVTAAPDPLDFGGHYIGTTAMDLLTVKNIGTLPLNVSGLSVDNTEFSVDPGGFILQPQESRAVDVSFSPVSVGPISGTLMIASNDPYHPQHNVQLLGEGVIPPDIAVSPTQMSADLLVGQTSTQPLLIENLGGSDLVFRLGAGTSSLEVENTRIVPRPIVGTSPEAQLEAARAWQEQPEAYSRGSAPNGDWVRTNSSRVNIGKSFSIEDLQILILHNGDISEIQNLLLQFPDISVVDEFNGGGGTPTLGQLEQYDAVILAVNSAYADPDGIGNVLADYVDGGGGVVMTLASFIPGWEVGGRFLSEGYSPFVNGFGPIGAGTLAAFDASHPIMAGVTSAFGDLLGAADLANGAQWVADWSIGEPFVATKGEGVAGVNIFVASSGFWAGDVPLILHNAALWAGGLGSCWLSYEPEDGVVPANSSAIVDVTFDATNNSCVSGGVFLDTLVVSSNDPDEPYVPVFVSLAVTDAPNITVSADTIDFGGVFVGAVAKDTIKVTNTGTVALVVANITSSDGDYTVTPTNFSLAPSASKDVYVTFTPSTVAPKPAALTISSNDPDDNPTNVVILGEGLAPPVISVSPESFADDLLTGQTSVHALSIGNTGGSDLEFAIGIQNVVSNAPYQVRTRATRSFPEPVIGNETASMGSQALAPEETAGDPPADWEATVPPPGAQTVFFKDNFEDGNFDGWLDAGGSGSKEVTNQTAADGSVYSYHEFNSASGHFHGIYQEFGAIQPAYIEFYVRSASTATHDAYCVLRDSGGREAIWFFAQANGFFYINANVGGNESVPYTANTWYRIELKDIDFTAKTFDYYVDGALVQADISFRNASSVNDVYRMDIYTFDGGVESWWDEFFISSGEEKTRFVSVDPVMGTVPPNTTLDVAVIFDAKGLNGGDYAAILNVENNDPLTPVVSVPATLHVTGAPDIAVSENQIDFGQVFVGGTAENTIRVVNEGTDLLSVSGVTSSHGDFTTDAPGGGFVLGPGAFQDVVVTFAPSEVVARSEVLTITSNDPDEPVVEVALLGEGLAPPVISVSPDSFDESLLTGQTSVHVLTISNTGGNDLEFDIGAEEVGGVAMATSAVRTEISIPASSGDFPRGTHPPSLGSPPDTGNDGVSPVIPETPLLTGSVGSAFATETANDQAARFNLNTPEVLNLFGSAPNSIWAGDFGLGDNAFAYAINNINQLMEIDTTSGTQTILGSVTPFGGETWTGMSVDPTDGQFYATSTNIGSSSLYTIDPVGVTATRIGAIGFPGIIAVAVSEDGDMFAYDIVQDVMVSIDKATGAGTLIGSIGFDANFGQGMAFDPASGNLYLAAVNNLTFQAELRIADTATGATALVGVLGSTSPGGSVQLGWLAIPGFNAVTWLGFEPDAGVVPPGGSMDVEVTFDAFGLFGGDYAAIIGVENNDPLTPVVSVPATLHVTGAPDIAVSDDQLDFGQLFVGAVRKDTIRVINEGTDLLSVTGVTSSHGDFTTDAPGGFALGPGDSRDVEVTFAPSEVVARSETLSITSNDPDEPVIVVALMGEGLAPPVISVSPGSFADDLLTGEVSVHTMSIGNTGGNDLEFAIGIQNVVSNAPYQVRTRATRSFPEPVIGSETASRGSQTLAPEETAGAPPADWEATVPPPGAQTIFFKDNFEDGDFNGWLDAGGSGSKEVTNQTGADGTVYSYHEFNSGSGHFHGIYQEFGAIQPTYIEFYVRSASTATNDVYCVLRDSGGREVIWFFARSSGFFYINANVGGNESVPYTANTWYRIELKDIDFTAKTFDYYVDGALVQADISFRNAPSANDLYRMDIYTYDGGVESWWDEFFISSGEEKTRFVSVDPVMGTVPPNTTLDVAVIFDARGLNGGDYAAILNVENNDPLTPVVSVPATLHVTGAPDIAVSENQIDFGQVFVGGTAENTIRVVNEGSDLLSVSGVTSSHGDFTTDAPGGGFVLGPGAFQDVVVTFAPSEVVARSEVLTITSNDPDEPVVEVALLGEGLAPPVISVSPSSLSDSLPTGDTSLHALSISNTGGSDLEFSIVLQNVVSNAPYQVRTRATRSFPEPVIGNETTKRSSQTLAPEETAGAPPADWEGNVPPPGAQTIFFKDNFEDGDFNGWLDGGGSGSKEVTNQTAADNTVYSYHEFNSSPGHFNGIYQEFGAIQPTYVEFYIRSASTATNDAYVVLRDSGGREVIWFFARSSGFLYINADAGGNQSVPYTADTWYRIELKDIDYTAKTFDYYVDEALVQADISFRNASSVNDLYRMDIYPFDGGVESWWDEFFISSGETKTKFVSVDPLTGTVPPGATLELDVTFDATNLAGGDYEAVLNIENNDPVSPLVPVPATLHVYGVPDIAVSGAPVNFGQVFVGESAEKTIRVSNEGVELLSVTGVTSSHPDFTTDAEGGFVLASGEFRDVVVTFAPTAPGPRSEALTILSNDPDEGVVLVGIGGLGVVPPAISVSPSSVADTLYQDEISVHALSIGNMGGSDLTFQISLQGLAPNATSQPSARTTRPPLRPVMANRTIAGSAQTLGPEETAGDPPADWESSVPSPGPQAVYFEDNFEDGDFNGWLDGGGSGSKEVTNQTAADATIYSYHEYNSAAGPFNGIYQEFGAIQPGYIEFYIRSSSTIKNDAYCVLRDSAGREVIWFFARSTGVLYVNADVGGNQSVPYVANTWYRIELDDIDFNAKTFDYYVNGALIQADISFRNAASVNDLYRMDIFTYDGQIESWWDEFFISSGETKKTRWISVEPITGTVPPGAALNLDVTFNATGLAAGDYMANIAVQSNDPLSPEVLVPAHLRVDSMVVSITGIDDPIGKPERYALHENFPNPFNPVTTIRYELPEAVDVQLSIFNAKGERIRDLVREYKPAGRYDVTWDGRSANGNPVASGVYFYRLRAGEFLHTKKMVLLK